MDYQKFIFTGNLTRDPESRYIPSGKLVCTFTVAVNLRNKKTMWVKVSAWESLGETCAKYLVKGSKCLVECELSPDDSGNPRTWNRQDGSTAASFEVTAQTVRFLSSKNEGADMPVDEEEIPF